MSPYNKSQYLVSIVLFIASVQNRANAADATVLTTATTSIQTPVTTPAPPSSSSSGFCWGCGFDFGVSVGALNNSSTGMFMVFGMALLCCVMVGLITCLACYCSYKPKAAKQSE